MAVKTFKVKLSSISTDIAAASAQFGKIRKSLSEDDQKRLDLKVKHLKDAKESILLACGRTGRMTSRFVAKPKPKPKPKR